jgi:hypothetical protein
LLEPADEIGDLCVGVSIFTQKKLDGVLVVNGEIDVSTRTQDAQQLKEPPVCEVTDVREDGVAVDEIEVVLGKRQMGYRRGREKAKRLAEVLLGPRDSLRVDVDSPQLGVVSLVGRSGASFPRRNRNRGCEPGNSVDTPSPSNIRSMLSTSTCPA